MSIIMARSRKLIDQNQATVSVLCDSHSAVKLSSKVYKEINGENETHIRWSVYLPRLDSTKG